MTKDITTLQERPEKQTGKSNAALAPELDPSRYMADLHEMDLSEAEKIELLEVLWSVMYSFVRLGFDVKNCGQMFENFTLGTQGDPGAIDSSHSDNEEKPSSKKRKDASP